MKPKVENKTLIVLAIFMGLVSFLLGLGSLGVLDIFRFSNIQFYGAFLLLASVMLATEVVGRTGLSGKFDAEKIMAAVIFLFSIGLGIWQIAGKVVSAQMQGAAGIVYIVLGILLVYEIFK